MSGEPNLKDSVKQVKAIADGVVHVSRVMKELEDGALTERAILILLAAATGQSQKTIKQVLGGLKKLEELYVKPKE